MPCTTLPRPCKKQGRYDEAISLYRATLDQRRRVLGPNHENTLLTFNNLVALIGDRGDFPRSIEMLERFFAENTSQDQADRPTVLMLRHNYGNYLVTANRPDDAEPVLRDTLERRGRVLGKHHRLTLTTLWTLGESFEKAGNLDEAIRIYRQVLATVEQNPDAYPNRRTYRTWLANLLALPTTPE